MKTRFITDNIETPVFGVFSVGELRESWASRLRNEVIAEGLAKDPNYIPSNREMDAINESVKIQAANKFTENGNYLVRVLEDDGVTPVAVFGEEATLIHEIEPVIPPSNCYKYVWDLRLINPQSTEVTLAYVNCEGNRTTYTNTAANIGSFYRFQASSEPSVTGGIIHPEGESNTN